MNLTSLAGSLLGSSGSTNVGYSLQTSSTATSGAKTGPVTVSPTFGAITFGSSGSGSSVVWIVGLAIAGVVAWLFFRNR